MNKFNRLALFLLSISLCSLVSPEITRAESATSTLPIENAGMSAYVELDSIDQAAFDRATANFFTSVESFDSGYMIGLKDYYAYNNSSEALVQLHFYLRTDGWLVVYLLDTQEASMMVNWNDGASLDDNLLKLAIEDLVAATSLTPAGPIKYYNFEHPEATKMTLVRENIANGDSLTDTYSILIPGTVQEVSYALASFGGALNAYTTWVSLYVDNTFVANIRSQDNFIYGICDNSLFTAQISHKVALNKHNDEYSASAATLILYSAD